MSSAERFDAIAAAIAALPTEAERAAAAVQIFGRAGAELLPLFSGGAEGIAAARAEAERLGLALTNAQGQDIEAMNDSFTMVQKAIAGVVQQVVAYLSPAITAIANTFTDFVGDVGGANIGQAIGVGILQGARILAQIGDWLIANLSAVWQYVAQVGQGWSVTVASMQQVAAVFNAVFNAAGAAFLLVIRGATAPFSWIIQKLAGIISYLPGAAGEFGRQIQAGADGFANGLDDAITKQVDSLKANVDFATQLNPAGVGEAMAGPLVTAFDTAQARAEKSANAIDVASSKPIAVEQTVSVNVDEALKGIDSRSQEGVAEMYRIMRGGTGDVQNRIAIAVEQVAENTARGDESSPFPLD